MSCSNMETVCTFQFLPLLILPFAVSDWKSDSVCQHVVPPSAFGQLKFIAEAKCCSLSGVIRHILLPAAPGLSDILIVIVR